ncbi:MAG: TVP38/TMEM64 family protein [Patescibacteria group bacterium]|nr:TVP38/TMEM64 family protein [Patescibacteria group bacterium]
MSWFRMPQSTRERAKLAAYAAGFAFFVWLMVYFGTAFASIFTSPDAVRAWVLQFGRAAPLALFLLQVAQVIIAPINNFLINLAGGYIFGPWMGFAYNYTGWITGAILVFWLSRYFGRGFMRLFFKEEKLRRYDVLLQKGTPILFILFLLPGPPDDLLVYGIGLARTIRFRTFLWMILIGKIPGKLATSFLGAGVADHNMLSFAIYGVFIAASLIVLWLKPELRDMATYQNTKKGA